MGTYPLVSLDTLLRWAEVAALTLSVIVVLGVALFIATVLHVTRSDMAPPSQPRLAHRRGGRSTPHTVPGI